jgi:hypothetical protein
MPDHVHLFFRAGHDFKLAQWVNWVSEQCQSRSERARNDRFSNQDFFDDILRNDESYIQKWEHVREISVRAELVARSDDSLIKANLCSSIGHEFFAAGTAATTPELSLATELYRARAISVADRPAGPGQGKIVLAQGWLWHSRDCR